MLVHNFEYEVDIKLVLKTLRKTLARVVKFQDCNILVFDRGGKKNLIFLKTLTHFTVFLQIFHTRYWKQLDTLDFTITQLMARCQKNASIKEKS